MDAHELPLEELISPARYQRYRAAAWGDTARAARLYMWNCDLSAAYWPSIALVEVAIRNAIDSQLCNHLGVTRQDGWHTEILADRPRIRRRRSSLGVAASPVAAIKTHTHTQSARRMSITRARSGSNVSVTAGAVGGAVTVAPSGAVVKDQAVVGRLRAGSVGAALK